MSGAGGIWSTAYAKELAIADVRNVFVLMLENRSFDHMLGFSAIKGFDAATGAPTVIDGLDGTHPTNTRGRPIRWRIRLLIRCRSTQGTNLSMC